jgi:polysaccharide deacetylase family protein (PEP-CTERM system associated)
MTSAKSVPGVETRTLIFSLDLEDHTGAYRRDGRFVSITHGILDFLDSLSITGTFFAVGKAAESCTSLIAEVARRGHEVACHSYDHTPLEKQTPVSFLNATQRAKKLLEDCIGCRVKGYRAPIFSLTEKTLWAPDLLRELGFMYSSSVLPAKNPLYGYPTAPRNPFRWSNGLIEFPCPVTDWGPVAMPFLGGIYLRYLPLPVIRMALNSRIDRSTPWTYCHPYDFDYQEGFSLYPGVPAWASLLLCFNRRATFSRVESLFEGATTTQFNTLTSALAHSNLPTYDPLSAPPERNHLG